MANLNKLLVHVPSTLCDDFKNKYVTAETNRDTSYDSKIVFLEKTQEIFAKGKIYSTSVLDFSSLQQLVSSLQGLVGNELPEGVTSTNIIDYIGEVKENLIGSERNTYYAYTIWGAKKYADHQDEVIMSQIIGSSNDPSYVNTVYGVKAYAVKQAAEQASYVRDVLPEVTYGGGILVKTTPGEKGNKIYEVSNAGVIDVNTSYSLCGIGLAKTGGVVKINVTQGEVKEDNSYVITGSQAYTAINSATTELKTELIGYIGDDPSEDTIYGAKSYAQSLDSKLHDSVVSFLIGSQTFDTAGSNTIWGAKKYANEADVRVARKLPTVSQGTGITVTPTTDKNGKINYEISTYPDIFHYKGNVTTTSALPSTENIKGDVWSVGTDKAAGSVLYAWDGDEWINIGSPNSVTGVVNTASHGVSLSRTADGRVQVNVALGDVGSGNGNVVTGGQIHNALSNYVVNIDSDNSSYLDFSMFFDQNEVKSYTAHLNEQAIFNYVADNIWETYKV